jgi:hypothetical protein
LSVTKEALLLADSHITLATYSSMPKMSASFFLAILSSHLRCQGHQYRHYHNLAFAALQILLLIGCFLLAGYSGMISITEAI